MNSFAAAIEEERLVVLCWSRKKYFLDCNDSPNFTIYYFNNNGCLICSKVYYRQIKTSGALLLFDKENGIIRCNEGTIYIHSRLHERGLCPRHCRRPRRRLLLFLLPLHLEFLLEFLSDFLLEHHQV